MGCPVKNSPEWKLLIQQVGVDAAWLTWGLYNENFPKSLANTSTIKKDIGIKSNMSELQLAMMAKKLEKYNAKYGTSHSFDKNKMGQANLYNPILKVCYFPKSITQKIINDGNMSVIGNDVAKSFINTNPSLFIQEGNQFFKDGEVFPTIDDALGNSDYLPEVKKGISELFEINAELANIGTQEQYSQYLDTIFPDSKVKDIVYHGSPNTEIESFLSPEKKGYKKQETTTTGVAGIYFTNKKHIADVYQDFKQHGIKGKTYSVLINVKRPLIVGNKATDGISDGTLGADALWNIQKGVIIPLRKAGIDAIQSGEYASKVFPMGENIETAVFEPEQIHILGSKQDIEGFKKFVEEDNSDYLLNSIIGDNKPLSPKFQELANKYSERVKLLHKSIYKLTDQLKDANVTEKVNLTKRIEELKRSVEKIVGVEGDIDNRGVINDILKLNALEDIEVYAEDQFTELTKIFSGDRVSDEDMAYARDVISLWLKAGDFSQTENLFWSEDELERLDDNEVLKQIKIKFNDYRNRAEEFNRKYIIPIEESIVENSVIDEFNVRAAAQINKPFKDINWATKMLLDASEVDDPVVQLMNTYLHRATFYAHQESLLISSKVDDLIKNIDKLDWELFEQTFSNTDNRKTGDLVYRFSQEYHEQIKEKFSRARKAPIGESKRKAYKEAIDFLRENSLIFDVRKLFADKDLWHVTYTDSEIEAHKDELKRTLGEKGYQEYYDRAEKKIELYKLDRESQIALLNDDYNNNAELVKAALSKWEANNSPAAEAELVEKGYPVTKVEDGYATPSGKYSIKVPKRFDNNGNDTGFYDKKFEKIEANDNLKALYDYVFTTINELTGLLPKEKTQWMQVNSLPTIYNTIIEDISKSKSHNVLTPLMDSLKEATRMSDLSTVDTRNRDTITGEPSKNIQIQMVVNYKKVIEDELNTTIIEYKQANNNENPSYEQVQEFKKNISDKLSKLKTFDLGKLTKAYAHMALTYKHKAAFQPIMEASNNHLNRKLEQQINSAGKDLKDINGNPIVSKGLTNLKDMLDTVMDTFYGYSLDKPSGQTDKQIYTSREQLMKERLDAALAKNKEQFEEGIITEDDYELAKEMLQDQLDVLGGVRVWSKWGDMVLKYVQLKGMGWNVFAGATNMLYGFISNVTEASDGRNYNMEEFWKAQGKVMHTIGGVNRYSKEAKKIKALMTNLNILKDSRNELYKSSTPGMLDKSKKMFDLLNPYKPQSSTEYINQATVMVAMLLHQKVNLDGREVSMYDAYDDKGNLMEGTVLPEKLDETKIKIKVDKVTKMNHGNYDPDNTIMAKRYLLGRALSQFRTWAFQGFAERFMGEMDDWQLDMKRKGRWLSIGTYYKTQNKENGMGFINSTFFLTKQLMRKATFGAYNTQFDEIQGLSEVDAANMRKNMTEIMVYVTMTIMALLLKAAIHDDKNKAKYLAFFWINQLTRLNTDMAFYISPIQFEKLSRNAMPAFTAVIDTHDALIKSWNFITDSESDIIQSGENKYDSKAGRAWGKVLPNPVTQVYGRLKSASTQVYSNKTR